MTLTTARCAAAAVPVVAALLCFACGDTDHERSEFVIECTNECAAGYDREVCAPYCECAFGYTEEHPELRERLESGEASFTGGSSPESIGMLGECGSDLYDHIFLGSCPQACAADMPEEECTRRCECMLRELRGSGPRAESTVWILQNLGTEPNPEARARIESAERTCLQGE